jgi:5-deoxy-D-glucuronate isomerase
MISLIPAVEACETDYLNVMAGPTRLWAVANDPDHEWTQFSEEHR